MLNINNVEWSKVTGGDVKAQIEKTDVAENFFYEFKSARESTSKMMKEVSAFSNTFGGYIFIGVEDDKTISGCGAWTEERLHTTIHDTITPTPIFDVKEFEIDAQSILVIRIEEGLMPPYIVNDGRIYERVSSGSYPINDAAKLNQLITKRREFDERVAEKIELEPIDDKSKWCPENLCAYIDVGFYNICRDEMKLIIRQDEDKILEKVAAVISEETDEFDISIIGNRILITLFYSTAHDGNGNEVPLGSGIQNFIEIMNDGSVRLRIMLFTLGDKQHASITEIVTFLYIFQKIYLTIVGDDFDKKFVCARKYEKLTVLRQFIPYYYLDETNPDEVRAVFDQLEETHTMKYGKKHISIGNRFPSSGYFLFDKDIFDRTQIEWNTNNIVHELVNTVYRNLGFVERPHFSVD